MTIEEPNKIDMIAQRNGMLEFVAVDPGLIEDDQSRFEAVLRKLIVYLSYVISDQFASDYPDRKRSDVCFRVVCAKEPTEQMLEIGVMKHPDFPDIRIDVEYEVIPSRY